VQQFSDIPVHPPKVASFIEAIKSANSRNSICREVMLVCDRNFWEVLDVQFAQVVVNFCRHYALELGQSTWNSIQSLSQCQAEMKPADAGTEVDEPDAPGFHRQHIGSVAFGMSRFHERHDNWSTTGEPNAVGSVQERWVHTSMQPFGSQMHSIKLRSSSSRSGVRMRQVIDHRASRHTAT
jgi:hypothetical protein